MVYYNVINMGKIIVFEYITDVIFYLLEEIYKNCFQAQTTLRICEFPGKSKWEI